MAAPPPHPGPVGPDTLITVKVIIEGQNRRFKLALRDLGANVLPQKLRFLLAIPADAEVKFDRFSDSAGTYITLDSNNPAIYKQLYRAAKAKLKLRLRATIVKPTRAEIPQTNIMDDQSSKAELEKLPSVPSKVEPRQSYLETVLSKPLRHEEGVTFWKGPKDVACQIPGAFCTADPIHEAAPIPSSRFAQLSQPTLPTMNDFSGGMTFIIDCNNCGKYIPNEHYHCGVCEKGDFDLCPACVDSGVTCHGDSHWLIKRFIQNGIVIPSITETRAPRKTRPVETVETSFKNVLEANTNTEQDEVERTCNSCINQLPGKEFVTCMNCPDYDLCFTCFENGEHGHHPAHIFDPVDRRTNAVNPSVKALCGPARGIKHQATCDGCENLIVGVRHKCLSCPDWDYCALCVLAAKETHPGHRFAALYEPLAYLPTRKEIHRGIYCDGPLCASRSCKSYIRGDRYKCAVCHDTDFCANCEASPVNSHSETHPLIKIRTPIRHVSITTFQEGENGHKVDQLGDRPLAKNAATETVRTTSSNAATQVHTVAESIPTAASVDTTPTLKPQEVNTQSTTTGELQAWYEADSTPDGSNFGPNRLVSQSWTLRNPGPNAWPVGCAVHFIGGDDMRNLDSKRPSSITTMTVANRSNVLEYRVQPGETAVFTVLLKSPSREGRAISYWRLKTPDGRPFGHKLWVDINVTATPVELPIRPANPVSIPVVTSEDEKVKEPQDNSTKDSTMIFPKLDKESPVSSVHDIAQNETSVPKPMVKDEDQELLEEIESLELEDEESDEEGFMTDEEYDILDASDEDFLMEAQQGVGKK